MQNLIFPQKVTVRLVDGRGKPVPLANVIVTVHLFARRKNDFDLGPYVSNEMGVITFTESDLRHDVEATYDGGLMDYVSVESCYTFVEVRIKTEESVLQALNARENVWKNLLKGERERWGSIENLLSAYRQSNNGLLNVHKDLSRVRDDWDGSKSEYQYDLRVSLKQ